MDAKSDDRNHIPVRCGVVLAAGDGKRLQNFIRRLRGDVLPKQYVNFIGTRSMLEHTFRRAERLIPPERLFTVVSQDHLRFPEVRQQLSSRPRGRIVVQPENKETGPGLLLPLIHLSKHYPESTAVVFPSDHFIVEEDLFMIHVEVGFRLVEQDRSRIILLGMEPSGADPEYGYILPGKEVRSLSPLSVRAISQFIEKPKPQLVQELLLRGALWNTMVMVFRTKTLIEVVGRIAPALYRSFEKIRKAVGTTHVMAVVEKAYKGMQPMNFSMGLLEVISLQDPSPLWVLPVRGVHWSDLGSAHRIMDVLRKAGHLEQSVAVRSYSEERLYELQNALQRG